jgi:hypothetical protein
VEKWVVDDGLTSVISPDWKALSTPFDPAYRKSISNLRPERKTASLFLRHSTAQQMGEQAQCGGAMGEEQATHLVAKGRQMTFSLRDT